MLIRNLMNKLFSVGVAGPHVVPNQFAHSVRPQSDTSKNAANKKTDKISADPPTVATDDRSSERTRSPRTTAEEDFFRCQAVARLPAYGAILMGTSIRFLLDGAAPTVTMLRQDGNLADFPPGAEVPVG